MRLLSTALALLPIVTASPAQHRFTDQAEASPSSQHGDAGSTARGDWRLEPVSWLWDADDVNADPLTHAGLHAVQPRSEGARVEHARRILAQHPRSEQGRQARAFAETVSDDLTARSARSTRTTTTGATCPCTRRSRTESARSKPTFGSTRKTSDSTCVLFL